MSSKPRVEHPFSIRPVCADDEPALRELEARPEVRDRLGQIVAGREDLRQGIRAIDCQGVLAGIVGLVPSTAFDGKDVELVCAVRETYEDRGLATSSCSALLRDAFATRDRVLACIAPTNSDGRSLAKRLGFNQVGTRATSDDEVWQLRASHLRTPAV